MSALSDAFTDWRPSRPTPPACQRPVVTEDEMAAAECLLDWANGLCDARRSAYAFARIAAPFLHQGGTIETVELRLLARMHAIAGWPEGKPRRTAAEKAELALEPLLYWLKGPFPVRVVFALGGQVTVAPRTDAELVAAAAAQARPCLTTREMERAA